jgi:hypothetical protein
MLFILILPYVVAHISMSYPPSRRNSNSEYYVKNNLVNYNLRSPLYVNAGPDYFTFPCKGFSKGPPTAEFSSNIKVTLEGTVIHNGGHCQFGISFNDKDFLVLHTVMTNCLLNGMTYEFPLPSNTPPGSATVFWTWVNSIGNREYYMECADVTIKNNNNNNGVVYGKELVVANILNYPTIPEFPTPNSPSGIDLFERAKQISISRDSNAISRPISTTSAIPTSNAISRPISTTSAIPTSNAISRPSAIPTSTAISRPISTTSDIPTSNAFFRVPTLPKSECETGKMKCCKNGGYYICNHGNWLLMPCAPGTACQQYNDAIICNYDV